MIGNCSKFTRDLKVGLQETLDEIQTECLPQSTSHELKDKASSLAIYLKENWIHIPYFPAFHRPGWLLKYAVGPYDANWAESVFADFWAGVTVALTLIPQGLSYATLANVPPVNGLYCAILPSAMYTFFGSAMTLAVGPVAIVSLLTGEIIISKVPNYATDTKAAVDLAGQIALCVGIILVAFSIFNCGNFIRYISHPVMAGFTSGAAMMIGLNQVKAAFGFGNAVPQAGQAEYVYNYQVMQWFIENWNGRYSYTAAQIAKKPIYGLLNGQLFRNSYAPKICFGTYVALIIIQNLKAHYKSNPERKKSYYFFVWTIFANLAPFISIIICAQAAANIKHDNFLDDLSHLKQLDYDKYSLKCVGAVASGVNILNIPSFKFDFGEIFVAAIPLALISYMESYSVARKIAAQTNELQLLNASQELWANGVANLLGAVSSAYPVSGSFSRSALNYASGAKTPLSKIVTMIVVIVALSTLTNTFKYIPQSALAAVIFAAVTNLISFTDLWHAWKFSKKDFFTMLFTWIMVLTFNTEIGILVGLASSILIFLVDVVQLTNSKPTLIETHGENADIRIVKVGGDITFLTANEIRDFVSNLTFTKEFTEDSLVLMDSSSRMYHRVSSSFEQVFHVKDFAYVDELPRAIILDLSMVRVIDLTGLQAFEEILKEGRGKGIKFVLMNCIDALKPDFRKIGLFSDESSLEINLECFLKNSAIVRTSSEEKMDDSTTKYGVLPPVEEDNNKHNFEIGVELEGTL